MTDEDTPQDTPEEPSNEDVVIWELRVTGSDPVTRWLVCGGRLTAKFCYTQQEADRAIEDATSYAKAEGVDVWIRRNDDGPPQRWKTFRPQQ